MQQTPEPVVVRSIPLGDIHVLPNPRRRIGDLAELTASIKQHGVQQPVLVRQGKTGFELVYGQRRFLATRAAALPDIPALVRDLTDAEVLEHQLVENGQREDVHPLEEAEAYEALRAKHGYSVDDIAAKVAKSRGYVLHRLKLCDLVPAAREAFYADKFTAQVAYYLARIPNPELQAEALKEVLKPTWNEQPRSTAEVLRFIQENFMLLLGNAQFDRKDASLVPPAGACGPCPKRTGNAPELFGDVSKKDVCIDPGCFKAKVSAAWTRTAESALERGHDVLTEAESAKLFPHGGQLAGDAGFVDLDARCFEDPKGRTWRQLLAKAPVPKTVAKDSFDKQHELVTKEAAKAALGNLGHSFPTRSASARIATGGESEKQRKAQMALKGAIVRAALADIAEKAAKVKPDAEFWKLLAFGFLQGSWHDVITDVIRRRGLQEKGKRPEEALEKLLPTLGEPQLRGLIVELVVGRGAFWQHATHYGETFTRACKVFGVDLKKVEAQVKRATADELKAA